jgi:hypothetical protein
VPFVVVPGHRVVEEGLLELHRRAAPPHHATRRPRCVRRLTRYIPVRPAHEIEPPSSIPLHTGETATAHRRPPPLAAGRALACDRSRQIRI